MFKGVLNLDLSKDLGQIYLVNNLVQMFSAQWWSESKC